MALPIETITGRGRITILEFVSASEITAGTVNADEDIPVAAARVGDVVLVGSSSNESLLGNMSGYVSAPGVVTMRAIAPGVSDSDFTSGSFQVTVFHRN